MKRPLEVLACGFVLGELGAYAQISPGAAAAAVTAALFAVLFIGEKRGLLKLQVLSLCLALSFFAGFLRMEAAKRPSRREMELDALLSGKDSGKTEITMRVDTISRSDSGLVLTGSGVRAVWKDAPAEETEAGAGIGARTLAGAGTEIRIGNVLRLKGRLSRFRPPTNPGEFDYALYFRGEGLTHSMYVDSLIVEDPSVRLIPQYLLGIRENAARVIDTYLPPDAAGFLKAALLGDRSGMDRDDYELYRKNGIAHIIAISGLHTGILGLGFYGALRKTGLGFFPSGLLSGIFLFFYSGLTGNGTGVSRAAFMLILLFAAAVPGRRYDLRSAAAAAALAMLLRNPWELFQCAFQLSFSAVLSIGGPGTALVKTLEIRGLLREKRGFKSALVRSLCAGAAATLWTLPIIAWWFFAVPLYSVLLNLVVIPLMTVLLSAGLLSVLAGEACFLLPAALSGLLGKAALYSGCLVSGILSFYRLLCEGAMRLPVSRVLTGRPPVSRILLYYLCLAAAWCIFCGRRSSACSGIYFPGIHFPGIHFPGKHTPGKRTPEKYTPGKRTPEKYIPGKWLPEKCSGLFSAAFLVGALLSLAPVYPADPEVWFLDVGQGDGILILKGDSCVVVDCGSSSRNGVGKDVLEPFLSSRAVQDVDAVFLTHADQDHMNGLTELLEEDTDIRIKRFILSGNSEWDPRYDELRALLRRRGLVPEYLSAGEQAGAFLCLSPQPGEAVMEDMNEQSLVLLFRWGDCEVLLTGDAGTASEEKILDRMRAKGGDGFYSWTAGNGDRAGPAGKAQPAGGETTGRQIKRILKAGHHGSRYSGSEAFLEWFRPDAAVISRGRGNRYGHPHPETLERLSGIGAEIYDTGTGGAVSAVFERNGGAWEMHVYGR